MTTHRFFLGRSVPICFVVALLMGAMLAAPAFAGSKALLTFTYECDVQDSQESLDDVTTTMKINGAIWDGQELCQKFVPPETIDLSGCRARRTAMRSVITQAADGACLVTDDDGGGTFNGDGEFRPALQVLCRSSEKKKFLPVLFAACEQIHSFESTISTSPP